MPTRAEVAADVKSIVEETLAIDPTELGDASTLGDDLAMTSLVLLEMVFAVEEHFGVTIPDETLSQLTMDSRFGEVIDVLHREIMRQASPVDAPDD